MAVIVEAKTIETIAIATTNSTRVTPFLELYRRLHLFIFIYAPFNYFMGIITDNINS